MIEPILIVAIVIACTAWYVQHKWRRRVSALALQNAKQGMTVLELLARRYARGEIDRDEYLEKRNDIVSTIGHPAKSGAMPPL